MKKARTEADQAREEADEWKKRAVHERNRKEQYKKEAAKHNKEEAAAAPQHATDLPFHFPIPQEWMVFRNKDQLYKYLRPELRKHGKEAKEEWIVEWCRELHRQGMITKDTMRTSSLVV